MNVLFISNDPALSDAGGAVRTRMRPYAAGVAKTGGALHVLTRVPHACEEQEGPLFVHRTCVSRLRSPWKLAKVGAMLLRAHSIDVVSAQDPFEHGLAALWAVRGTNAKLHIQVHTDYLSPWFVRGAIYRSPRV